MGVDHRRFYVFMPQQFLDSANIVMVLQKMSGKTMAERVATDPLINPCQVRRPLQSLLQSARLNH